MKNGPTDFSMVSADEYFDLCESDPRTAGHHTRKELHENARARGSCENCGQPIWRLVNNGMCFTCTTGESDASDDYELIPEPRRMTDG